MGHSNSIIILQTPSPSSKFCTLPRQRKSLSYSIKNVTFEKGPGKKSLGFTVVGGKDSPKGSIGIYVKSIFPNGQALGMLKEGKWQKIFDIKHYLKLLVQGKETFQSKLFLLHL